MDEPDNIDEVIMKYLDNEMTAAEKTGFEQRLSAEPELNNRVESLKLAQEAVKYHGMYQQVADVRKSWEEKTAIRSAPAKIVAIKKYVRYTLLAASIFLAFFLIKELSANGSSDDIYNQTYVGYQLSNLRSQTDSMNRLEQAYQLKQYSQVVEMSKQQMLSGKDQLLLGISFLNLNDPGSSVITLEKLRAVRDSDLEPDIEFYLALAYLKKKDYQRAVPLFKKISLDPNHLYHSRITPAIVKQIEALG